MYISASIVSVLEGIGYFFHFSDDEKSIECRSYRPTGHQSESFIVCIATNRRYMPWFNHHLVFHGVDEFSLVEIDDDFITNTELIEESKNIIVFSFCPWIIGAVAKYETVSCFTWIG